MLQYCNMFVTHARDPVFASSLLVRPVFHVTVRISINFILVSSQSAFRDVVTSLSHVWEVLFLPSLGSHRWHFDSDHMFDVYEVLHWNTTSLWLELQVQWRKCKSILTLYLSFIMIGWRWKFLQSFVWLIVFFSHLLPIHECCSRGVLNISKT